MTHFAELVTSVNSAVLSIMPSPLVGVPIILATVAVPPSAYFCHGDLTKYAPPASVLADPMTAAVSGPYPNDAAVALAT